MSRRRGGDRRTPPTTWRRAGPSSPGPPIAGSRPRTTPSSSAAACRASRSPTSWRSGASAASPCSRPPTRAPGASGRNGEMIRSAFSTDEWIGLFDDSLRRWQTLSAELDFNVLFTKAGYLVLASTEAAVAACARNVALQRAPRSPRRAARARRRPAACARPSPRTWSPAASSSATPASPITTRPLWAYAQAAARLGVEIHPYTTVTGIGVAGRRRPRGRHRRGRCLDAEVVVDAAGGTGARDRAPRRRRRPRRDLSPRGHGDRAAGAVPPPRRQLAGDHGLLPPDHEGRVRRRHRAGGADRRARASGRRSTAPGTWRPSSCASSPGSPACA